jgi:aminoglycoside phosphotransferase (APT) family kinase protein
MKALENTAVRFGPTPQFADSSMQYERWSLLSQVPVPKMYAFCHDTSVLGVPFYVMEFVEGQFADVSEMCASDLRPMPMWCMLDAQAGC